MSLRPISSEELRRPMDSMFLTKDELTYLTGRRQRRSQAQALRSMGIVEQLFGFGAERRSASEPIPNWSAA
jgi:hypothetical protein